MGEVAPDPRCVEHKRNRVELVRGRAEKLDRVRVGIWSTKAVVARWFAPAPQAGAILDVDLQAVGVDRLAGTMTNRLDVPLRDAMICVGKQVYYQLGTIEPGATVLVRAEVRVRPVYPVRPALTTTRMCCPSNAGVRVSVDAVAPRTGSPEASQR